MTDLRPPHDWTITYDKPDGWVAYIEIDEVIYANAHTTSGRYTIGILRALKRILSKKGRIVTELVYNYLIDFYSKHYKVTSIGNNFYIVDYKEA